MTAIEILDVFHAMFEPHEADEYELYRQTVGTRHERILSLPSPPTRPGKEQLLSALERQECAHAKLLIRTRGTWRRSSRTQHARVLSRASNSPDRMKNRKCLPAVRRHDSRLGSVSEFKEASNSSAEASWSRSRAMSCWCFVERPRSTRSTSGCAGSRSDRYPPSKKSARVIHPT